MEPAVDVEDIHKTYGETTALSGVSISVGTGEVYGLLGPNGAGKTTLVRTVTGTTGIDSGSVSVFGASPTEIDRGQLGVLPQQFVPPERLTAAEQIRYFAGLYEESLDPDAVVETVGIGENDDTRYERLSGGQQRRVCLGIALVNDPDLLVLDEPTTGIDPAGRRQVRAKIADLAAGGTTVLVTSHDVDEIERLADRVCLLAGGEVVAEGEPGRLVVEHGGKSRLIVETGAGAGAETDLDAVGTEADIEVEGYAPTPVADGLAFEGATPAALGDLVAALDRQGVTYDALRWSRPDLEDVYLRLTGSQELVRGRGDLNRSAAADEPDGSAAADEPDGSGGDRP